MCEEPKSDVKAIATVVKDFMADTSRCLQVRFGYQMFNKHSPMTAQLELEIIY